MRSRKKEENNTQKQNRNSQSQTKAREEREREGGEEEQPAGEQSRAKKAGHAAARSHIQEEVASAMAPPVPCAHKANDES